MVHLQDEFSIGSEFSINPNSKIIEIVVDDSTVWPDVLEGTKPTSEQEFKTLGKDYGCATCGKLPLVSPTPIDSGLALLSCVICSNKFLDVVQLYQHFKLEHPKDECPILVSAKEFCVCKTKSNLVEPQKPKPPKKKKKVRFSVKCDICEQEFKCQQNLF